jgi:acyl carrier protein
MTHQDDIAEQVRVIIEQMAPLAPRRAEPDDHLVHDLGYDSLAVIELALELEVALGLRRIEEDEAMDVVTVRQVQELVLHALSTAEVGS